MLLKPSVNVHEEQTQMIRSKTWQANNKKSVQLCNLKLQTTPDLSRFNSFESHVIQYGNMLDLAAVWKWSTTQCRCEGWLSAATQGKLLQETRYLYYVTRRPDSELTAINKAWAATSVWQHMCLQWQENKSAHTRQIQNEDHSWSTYCTINPWLVLSST